MRQAAVCTMMVRLFVASVVVLSSLTLSAWGQTASGTAGPKPPSIIFILADDLGYGDLGCYGQKRIATPRLDRMAAEGMRFTSCYAGSTVCAPSRCCLMTGMHTGHARVRGNALVPLEPEDVTVAEVLKQAGYATGLVGKWGLEEKIPLHNEVPSSDRSGRSLGGVATRRVEYSHDLFAARALEFVEKHRHEPFFLYLALTIPHANNEAGNKGMEVPDLGPYADKDWPEPQKGHAAMITRMDRDIGRLLDRLRELGIDDNTIVFFASDNGPHKEGGNDPTFAQSSGPFQGIKRSLHEGGIRVPMIARWPGKVRAGVTSDLPWAFWDVLPTLAELAGVQPPAGIDGISVVPTLLGRPDQRQHEFFYWEFHEGGSQQAVRMGPWKAIRPCGGAIRLYDLRVDQGEEHDLAAEKPEIVAKIEAYLSTARTESVTWPVKPMAKSQTQ